MELPDDRLAARFDGDSTLRLTPELVGPAVTRNEGIVGEGIDLTLVHTNRIGRATLLYHLTRHLLLTEWRDPNDEPRLHLFGQLKRIARQVSAPGTTWSARAGLRPGASRGECAVKIPGSEDRLRRIRRRNFVRLEGPLSWVA